MTQPEPPDSLPAYLAEGLPKQGSTTLRATKTYLDALLEYRQQEIEADELPADAEPVAGTGGRGTTVAERVTCGDESCHCMSDGEKHGPYYRYVREGGRLTSEYIGKPSDGDQET